MIKVAVYNLEGKEVEKITLPSDVFSVDRNDELIHQVYVAKQANKRRSLAHTKTRGERAGSTRKPWKQKGTGRARTGSIRNPIWRKGGVTFGPSNEKNYTKKVNKKAGSKALKMVLSGKVDDGRMLIIDKFDFEEKKTKNFVQMLESLKIDKKALVSFVENEKDIARMSRNIPFVHNSFVDRLNISDLMHNVFFILSKDGVEKLQKRLSDEKKEQKKEVVTKKEKKDQSMNKKQVSEEERKDKGKKPKKQ